MKDKYNPWREVFVRLRSRTKHKIITYDLCVRADVGGKIGIVVGAHKSVVGVETKRIYKAKIAQISKCDGMKDLNGVFMCLHTLGEAGTVPVLLYENWNILCKRWEVLGRRVLIEKTGFYI